MFRQKQIQKIVERLQGRGIPLRLRLWDGTEIDLAENPRVTITIPTARALRYFLRPTLGTLGHAYAEGLIDVEGVIDDMVAVAAHLSSDGTMAGAHRRRGPHSIRHSRELDAEAIAYHYDVSNEFYSRWLDQQMVYSSAYFQNEGDTLEVAQEQKLDLILRKLNVRPGDRLLDIGCGWGALVMRAAKKFGVRALGITLSKNQYEFAREKIAAAGLADRCEVRIEDYRDLTGQFDRIASVGMYEHVGLKNLPVYFEKIRGLLMDDGIVLNQGITSTDPDSGQAPWEGGDFIERYVFLHGELPHISLVLKEMCAAGLEPLDVENLRRHYALTIRHWSERFEAQQQQLRALAGEKRWRIWRVYLAGCAYGFAHNWTADHQILAVKAGTNSSPLTRDYMYGASKMGLSQWP